VIVLAENRRPPDDEWIETAALTHVMGQLETLNDREATVLKMRFGLENYEPRTLKEIGESLGLTRERVRQIETEALNKLAEGIGP
jgi:RNA polymerase primary sigma factor